MKRFYGLLCAAVLMLPLSACASSAESSQVTVPDHMEIENDSVPQEYADCVKAYFEAVEKDDYAAYTKTIYPPYLESFDKYLRENENADAETAFHEMAHRFDEDGYESWRLTKLAMKLMDNPDPEGFFKTYQDMKLIDEAFVTQCESAAKEYQDVQFSLYAIYSGDAEPVRVSRERELFLIKTEDGVFLFG